MSRLRSRPPSWPWLGSRAPTRGPHDGNHEVVEPLSEGRTQCLPVPGHYIRARTVEGVACDVVCRRHARRQVTRRRHHCIDAATDGRIVAAVHSGELLAPIRLQVVDRGGDDLVHRIRRMAHHSGGCGHVGGNRLRRRFCCAGAGLRRFTTCRHDHLWRVRPTLQSISNVAVLRSGRFDRCCGHLNAVSERTKEDR